MRLLSVAAALAAWLAVGASAHGQTRPDLEPGEEEEVVEDYTRAEPAPPPKRPPAGRPPPDEGDATPDDEPPPRKPPAKKPPATPAKKPPATPAKKPPAAPAKKPPAAPAKKPPATAKPPPAAAPTTAGAPVDARTLFLHVTGPGLDDPTAAAIAEGARRGLSAAYEVTDLFALHARPGVTDRALADADRQLDHARTAVQELDIVAADAALEKAIAAYEAHLLDLAARDGDLGRLEDAYRLSAIARFLDGDEDGARRRLGHCLVLNPRLDYARDLFPPDMAAVVTEERLLFDGLGTGTLGVTMADGGSAVVYLNGRQIGPTPVHVENVRVGPNYVSLVVPGRPASTEIVIVEPSAAATVEATTPRFQGEAASGLERAAGEVGQPRAGARIRAAHAAVGRPDLMLFVTATGAGSGRLSLRASLYDLRSGKLVREVEGKAPEAEPGSTAERLARTATTAPALVSTGGAGPSSGFWDRIPRVWEHRYFWPVVGGVTVVGAAVVIGVAASSGLSTGERLVVFGVPF